MKLQSPQVCITKTLKKFPSVEGWQAKTDGVVSKEKKEKHDP